MSMYFVRHGQTSWNLQGKMQGRSDIELNETGREQAQVARELLKDVQIDKIYSSPLVRAKETAQIINQNWGLDICIDKRLRERSFGVYEGNSSSGIDFDAMWAYTDIPPYEDSEDSVSFYARVESFLDDVVEEAQDKNILIVAHGGVSIPYHCYFQGYEGKDLHGLLLGNCQIAHMEGKKYQSVKKG